MSSENERALGGWLYIVATPIGNLSEISLRALEILKSVDLIACENPRHSLKLLNHFGISKPLTQYFRHNEMEATAKLVAALEKGKSVALISDGGMPIISDPGQILVGALIERGFNFTAIGMPCAAVNALVLSGFSASSFLTLGFLPPKVSARARLIESVKALESTLIFYVAPHDLAETWKFLYENLGARRVAIARELTKLYESVVRTTLDKELEGQARGEYVLVVEGSKKDNNPLNELEIEAHIEHYIKKGLAKNDAIKAVAKDRCVKKSEIYKFGLKF